MPLPRFTRLAAEKRAVLLEAATREFSTRGYEAASLNEILAAADLGKSSYYYYFSDKEDLFATVVEDLWDRVARESEEPSLSGLTRRTFWPALEAWAERSVRVMANHPELVPLGRQIQVIWAQPQGRVRELIARVHAQTRAVLEQGQKLGCVRKDIDLDWLVAITRAADQAVDERFFERGSRFTGRALAEHVRVAFDTFRRLAEARE